MAHKLALLQQIEESSQSEYQPLELKRLVQQILAEFTEVVATKEIDLIEKLPPDLPLLQANKDQLRQAIIELVDNAVKYSPPKARVQLLAYVEDNGKNITLAVRDNGPGIWPKDIPFLFDRFFRVRNPHMPDIPGEGLGLALVKAVTKKHHGWVGVDSRVGRGTIFLLKLPLSPD